LPRQDQKRGAPKAFFGSVSDSAYLKAKRNGDLVRLTIPDKFAQVRNYTFEIMLRAHVTPPG
jgi:hypothetical protein